MAWEKPQPARWKIYIDFASLAFIGYFIGCFVWVKQLPETHGPLPIWIIIDLIDILPTVFGFAWLLSRYGDVPGKKFPIIEKLSKDWRFRLLALVALFSLVLFLNGLRR